MYDDFATSVKKFGYGGLTHLNQRQLHACFSQADQAANSTEMREARAIYFCQEKNSKEDVTMQTSNNPEIDVDYEVSHLLNIGILLCAHNSQQDQLNEMWLLVNPMLDETILS